jgi:hypothetical protein
MIQKGRYLAYLLRLWEEDGGEPCSWRASLQSPQSEELRGFAGLVELFAFLEDETGMVSPGLGRLDRRGSQPTAEPD